MFNAHHGNIIKTNIGLVWIKYDVLAENEFVCILFSKRVWVYAFPSTNIPMICIIIVWWICLPGTGNDVYSESLTDQKIWYVAGC